jgi:hypothetical protein
MFEKVEEKDAMMMRPVCTVTVQVTHRVQRTHRPRDAMSKGRNVQGTQRPRDALPKGLIDQGKR